MDRVPCCSDRAMHTNEKRFYVFLTSLSYNLVRSTVLTIQYYPVFDMDDRQFENKIGLHLQMNSWYLAIGVVRVFRVCLTNKLIRRVFSVNSDLYEYFYYTVQYEFSERRKLQKTFLDRVTLISKITEILYWLTNMKTLLLLPSNK